MSDVLYLGLGRIGLPTALLSCNKKNRVIGYDINKDLINNLKKGYLNYNENNIKILLKKNIENKKIIFSKEVITSDIFVITVPTPLKKNKTSNLQYVYDCIKKIMKVLKKNDLIILESTVPIGTVNHIKSLIDKKKPSLIDNYFLSYCPERILPGNTINELKKNVRIIGGINQQSNKRSINFYNSFLKVKYFITNSKTAEMIKLSENSFRDVNIAFANELMKLADDHNININDVVKGANLHPRVNILQPGIGVGGHCIPIDPYFLLENYRKNNDLSLINKARDINNYQPRYIFKKLTNYIKNNIRYKSKNLKIGILGITYKANTDDIRESPAIELIQILKKNNNYQVFYHDPFIKKISSNNLKRIDLKSLIRNSDILIKLVSHKEYNNIKNNNNQKINNLLSIDNGFI